MAQNKHCWVSVELDPTSHFWFCSWWASSFTDQDRFLELQDDVLPDEKEEQVSLCPRLQFDWVSLAPQAQGIWMMLTHLSLNHMPHHKAGDEVAGAGGSTWAI